MRIPVDFKKCLYLIGLFFIINISLSQIFILTGLYARLHTRFISGINNSLKEFFESTLFMAEKMIEKNTHLTYQGLSLDLNNAEVIEGHDTRINLINKKTLNLQIDHFKKTGINTIEVKMHSFKFSYWDFFILPMLTLLSLNLSSAFVYKKSIQKFLISTGIALLFLGIQFLIVLIGMRTNASNLEPFNVNSTLQFVISKLTNLFHIEFNYMLMMLIFLISHWTLIFDTIEKNSD